MSLTFRLFTQVRDSGSRVPLVLSCVIKDTLVDLIKRIFQRVGSLYFACNDNDRHVFFTSDAVRNNLY